MQAIGFYNVDKEEVIFANNEMRELMGLDGPATIEYWLSNIVHPDDRKEQKRYLEEKRFPLRRRYRLIDNTLIEATRTEYFWFQDDVCYISTQRKVS
jgi:hypothetical protein